MGVRRFASSKEAAPDPSGWATWFSICSSYSRTHLQVFSGISWISCYPQTPVIDSLGTGGIFERYVQQLIESYHPEESTNNASFDGGEIDILVDLSSEALAIEVKSGFIAQDIKGARSQHLLAAELKKKYVVDQDGKAKGVRQLAAAMLALRERRGW